MKIKVPCLTCGELSDTTRCEPCTKANENMRLRRHSSPKATSKQRGYTSAWRRLSLKARQQQSFCTDCGATDDLQADHTPEAWRRHDKGLPIRLADIDVVCGRCNRKRGAARGQHARSNSEPSNTIERVVDQQ